MKKYAIMAAILGMLISGNGFAQDSGTFTTWTGGSGTWKGGSGAWNTYSDTAEPVDCDNDAYLDTDDMGWNKFDTGILLDEDSGDSLVNKNASCNSAYLSSIGFIPLLILGFFVRRKV